MAVGGVVAAPYKPELRDFLELFAGCANLSLGMHNKAFDAEYEDAEVLHNGLAPIGFFDVFHKIPPATQTHTHAHTHAHTPNTHTPNTR